MAVLDDEALVLEERLFVANAEGFDASDGGLWDGQFGPAVAGNASTGSQGDEIAGPLDVAGGIEGEGADGTSAGRIGGHVLIEDLCVGAELDFHGIEIGARFAGNDGLRAECLGDAVLAGKLVQTSSDISNHVANHDLGKAAIGKTVCTGTHAFFDGANGAFHFADMTVLWDHCEVVDRKHVSSDTSKFFVGVNVA